MSFSMADLARGKRKNIKNKEDNKLIRRGGRFEPGTYEVVIAAVDTAGLSREGKEQVIVTFENGHKEQHKQLIFIRGFKSGELSDGIEALLKGLFGEDPDEQLPWLDLLVDGKVEHAFQLTRGMKLKIIVAETEGVIIASRGGQYFLVNSNTEQDVGGPFALRSEAKQQLRSRNLQEPNSILADGIPTDDDKNRTTLQVSIKAIYDAENSGDYSEPAKLETAREDIESGEHLCD